MLTASRFQIDAWNHLMVDREKRRREGHEGRVLQMNSGELSEEDKSCVSVSRMFDD